MGYFNRHFFSQLIGRTPIVATDYKMDCLGCHVPAKDRDWIYTEAYPTLLPD